ncbi:MAG: hypothetical protein IT166_15785 [Bryobacterales bacterium]|nr:hypothetical protein [Bryobacterales bacterium]
MPEKNESDIEITQLMLRNLTLHQQGDRETEIARRAGYTLSILPEGVEVGIGLADLTQAAEIMGRRLEECVEMGAVALVGGHTMLWIAAIELLAKRGKARPALAYFDTRRVRDASGRFVFEPERLVVLERKWLGES